MTAEPTTRPTPAAATRRHAAVRSGGRDQRRRGRRGSGVAPLRGLLPLAVLLAVWELIEHGRQSVFFPPPSQWYTSVKQLWQGHVLLDAIAGTVETFAISLVIATAIGTVIGILIGRVRAADRLLEPLLEYLRFLPGVVLVPLVVLMAGYTESMKLYVVVFGAIWPILLQVRLSARHMDPILVDVRRSLRMSRTAAARKIFVPHVVPGILLGVKIAAPLTLVLVLVVEISTQVSGLGKLLSAAQQNFQSAQVYGIVVIVGVIALVINTLVSVVESFLLRYRPTR
jgi:ABC-type nitrate/sulfonate/bicarbonate transport system permease component